MIICCYPGTSGEFTNEGAKTLYADNHKETQTAGDTK